MEAKQHHFVLVHGGGHGAWCWVKIVSVLEKAGHRVTTVDLVSAGENLATAPDDVTSLELYNQPLEDLFSSFPDDEKVILVGHSIEGMSISRVSELFPKTMSVAVYLAAFMPASSSKFYELIATDSDVLPRLEYETNCKVEGGPHTSVGFTPGILKEYLYSKCSSEEWVFAVKHVKRFPACLLAPIHLTMENYGSVPRIYAIPMDDKIITPAGAHIMITLNPPNEVHEIDADHSLFFSAVEIVENILNDAAVKVSPPVVFSLAGKGMSGSHVTELIKGVVEGETRVLAAGMIMEDVFKGTKEFSQQVFNKVHQRVQAGSFQQSATGLTLTNLGSICTMRILNSSCTVV